ncbi:hypothetical protein ACWGH7_13305 [Streptomyces cyaneofuscatus]|nr:MULTISPECIES: hypothetical protein [Streptomyces]ONI55582.1 hypothetical protein STIB_11550 [Streptomyces sp. IB2014 011-1]CAD5947315.1 conserved protein of unknown function [Streptomyces sp. KY70]CAD5986004.1 conserved protein of unknown function [Streptomyces sp. KY75]
MGQNAHEYSAPVVLGACQVVAVPLGTNQFITADDTAYKKA